MRVNENNVVNDEPNECLLVALMRYIFKNHKFE